MRDNGKEDAVGCEIYNEKEDARKRGGGRINEGGRIHDTNSFDVEKWGGGRADKRWGALWRYSTVVHTLPEVLPLPPPLKISWIYFWATPV